MADLGSHDDAFADGDSASVRKVRKCFLVFELAEETSDGHRHLIGKTFTLSFHAKSALRKLAEALLNDGTPFDEASGADLNYVALLGLSCLVEIKHVKSNGGARTYANVGNVSAVPKKSRNKIFQPNHEPTSWFVGQDLEALPSWLPRSFGEEVREIIARCHEMTEVRDEGEVSAGVSGEEPF